MCFSANASFGAGVVLTVIGVVAIKKTEHPSQILFASIPLFFAAQQFTEGTLWLILPDPAYGFAQQILTRIFLFFAQVLWPLWVPIAILLLEKQSTRRKIQKVLVGLGLMISAYLMYCLLSYPVEANIIGYHISYKQDYPIGLKGFGAFLYIMATIGPPFFSHIKKMWLLGVTILISYIITALFYEHYILSVWCFFASVISISIYLIILEIRNSNKPQLQLV